MKKIRPALNALVWAVLCAASAAVQADPAPAFTWRGWDLERFDPEYVNSRIREAARHNINVITLSHEIVMNAQEIRFDWHRYQHLKRFCDLAHRHGIQVYFWNHQLNAPPPHLVKRENGKRILDFDHPDLEAFLVQAYQEVVDRVPNLDGIVLSLTESEWPVHRGPHDPMFYGPNESTVITSALGPDARMAKVIGAVHRSLAARGKKLMVRDFFRSPIEMDLFVKAMATQPADIMVYTKSVPNDWQYCYPEHPLLGKFPDRVQVMELDIYNETAGNQDQAMLAPDYYQSQIRLARAKGMAGVIPRIDDGYKTSRGTAREFNLFCYNRLINNPDLDVEPLWKEFFVPYYGSAKAAEVAIRCLKRTFEIICANSYTLGFWTGRNAASIAYTDRHLDAFSSAMWSPEQKYKDIETLLLAGGPEAIRRTVAEKKRAEDLAALSLKELAAARKLFTADRYAEIEGYFLEAQMLARINQVWVRAYYALRALRRAPRDAAALAETRAALQACRDFVAKAPVRPHHPYVTRRYPEAEDQRAFYVGGLPDFIGQMEKEMERLAKDQ